MPTAKEALVASLNSSKALLNRYCDDLQPQEYLHRPCPGANCAAWTLGHLVLSERASLRRLDVTDLPALPENFEARFSRDPEAPKASEFGDVTILLPLFNQHRQMLIDAVGAASAEQLEKPLEKPHPLFSSVWGAISFMSLHVAMHAGQITIIRRSLGRPPVI